MAKPEWGTKRTCQGCGAKFYDFSREPMVCPKCEKVFVIEESARSRRARNRKAAEVKAVVPAPAVAEESADPVLETDDNFPLENNGNNGNDGDTNARVVDIDNNDEDDIAAVAVTPTATKEDADV